MSVSLATQMAPPFVLVAHFFIASVIFLGLSGMALPFLVGELNGYFISHSFAAFAHLYLLGFVMMVIFGAMYQLLPVVLEAPLFSKDFAYVQFYMYVLGLSVMVSGFAFDSLLWLLPYGALMTYLSMLIFCINVFLTFARLKTITLEGKFLLVATLFLFVSVGVGLAMGLNMAHGFLDIDMNAWSKAHMIGTLGGFVLMVIMGVAMVLLPMFSLAHGYSKRWIEMALYLHSFGIVSAMGCLMFGYEDLAIAPFAMLMVSSGLFVIQMGVIFKSRVRKQNDYWVKNIAFALICFTCSLFVLWFHAILGGILIFFGFLMPLIVGHIYKILPFLVWYEKFSPLVGKQKVPLLHQMICTSAANTQTWIHMLALCVMILAVVMQSTMIWYGGNILLLSSISLVIYNTLYVFYYKIKE